MDKEMKSKKSKYKCNHKNISHRCWEDCYSVYFPYIVCLDCNNEVIEELVEVAPNSIWMKKIYKLSPKGNEYTRNGKEIGN